MFVGQEHQPFIDAQIGNPTCRLAADGTSAGRNAPVAVPATAKRCAVSFLSVNSRHGHAAKTTENAAVAITA